MNRQFAGGGIVATFFLLTILTISCQAFNSSAGNPVVIISSPPSGSQYNVGDEIIVQSTATDPNGVVRMDLLVDGSTVRSDPSPVAQGQAQFSLIQSWIAASPGQHTLTVRAYNSRGAFSDGGIVAIVNGDSSIQPVPTAFIATAVALATLSPNQGTTPSSGTSVSESTPSAQTPTGGACISNSQFVADVTIPDGTVFTPGAIFTKTWRVRNNGTCPWNSDFALVFVSGTQMAAESNYSVPLTAPGAVADLSVPMTAPASFGQYTGLYHLRDSHGNTFGPDLTVVINIPAPAVTSLPQTQAPNALPTAAPTVTPSGCKGQPDNFDFSSSPNPINPGGSTTLSWSAITNASGVFLDGDGVTTPGSRIVSPLDVTTYTLNAVCGNFSRTKQVTVTVSANFSGDWFTNLGPLHITQTGNVVSGTYHNSLDDGDGTIAGTVSGRTLTGTYSIGGTGTIEFNLTPDGNQFDGNWDSTNKWCAARPGQRFADGCSFAGAWTNRLAGSDNCSMTLTRNDNNVTGNYCSGTLIGTISYEGGETVLSGQYHSNNTGPFKFYLFGYNALQFNGNWNGANEWCGWRSNSSKPDPCLKP